MSTVLVIGSNASGECGVHNKTGILTKLTNLSAENKENDFSETNIEQIYNGKGYTIYAARNDDFYASGNNKHYSCCVYTRSEHIDTPQLIDYFHNKSEKVTQITKEPTMRSRKKKKKKKQDKKRSDAADEEQTDRVKVEHSVSVKSTSLSKIAIKKLCVNVSGYCTFFISENNVVYANGNNRNFQLGFKSRPDEWFSRGFKYICEPKKVDTICSNLIDIKSSSAYSVALRMSDRGVMLLYCNQGKYSKETPLHIDVLNLIVAYVGELSDTDCAIYQTGRDGRWMPNGAFMHKYIVKIECGETHSLALDEEGVLWAWGNNRFLQCGLPLHDNGVQLKSIRNAMYVPYFKQKGIKIKDMKCGWNHNLVLDVDGNVYAFGDNQYGQCAVDSEQSATCSLPVLVTGMDGKKASRIECGANHSMVATVDGKWFLFGKNDKNQCVTQGDVAFQKVVHRPYCINAVVKRAQKGKIKKVMLGVDNTQIMLQ